MSDTDRAPGGCPFCGFYPAGGFETESDTCPVCGVARDGTDANGDPARVPADINEVSAP
jgi:hypothetical protein